jgi:hypothetical protein
MRPVRVRSAVLGLVTALAVASGAAATHSAGAAAPPTSPPADEPVEPVGEAPADTPAAEALPDGYGWLVDDTGLIAVVVPDTWSDVDTAPTPAEDGGIVPRIAAAPDIAQFTDTFNVAGVEYFAIPYTDDPQTTIDEFGLSSGCEDITVEDYTDPVFTGLVQVGTSCGATGEATWNMVVASPDDQSLTAVVRVQSATAADAEAMDFVLRSFNIVEAAGGGPGTSVPGTSVPGTSVPGDDVADDDTVIDDKDATATTEG